MFKVFPTTSPHHISSPFARFFFFKFSYKWDKRQLGFPLARPPLHKTHVRAVRSRTGISKLAEIYWAHLPFVDRNNALLREKSLKLFKLPKLVRVAASDFFLAQLQIASKSWPLQKSLPMVEPIFARSKSLLLQFYTRKAKKDSL